LFAVYPHVNETMATLTGPIIQEKQKAAARRRLPTIVLVALALRLAAIPFNNFENLMDAAHIHAWEQGNVARALVAGQGFGSPFVSAQPSAIMPPVYPLIVAGFFRLFGVHSAQSILAVHAFDCLINSLACIPIFLLARRSFGERAAWWAAWAWAISPYGIYFSAAWAWGTHLLLLCLCWLLYLAQDLERSPRLGLWAGFGLLAGFAGLTEPSILVVVPFLLALAAWRLARAGHRWLLPGAVASLTLAAVLSPWLIRDALVFHRFIPVRDSMGLELWMGNNGSNLHWTSDDLHPLHDAQELTAYNAGELAYMDHKAAQAKTYIKDHPGWYAWMCARRAVYLWTGYWSIDPRYLAQEPADPENVPFATCLTLLGTLGLFLAWRERPFEVIRYCGVLVLLPVMYYFTHPEPYDMRALDPLLAILGCSAIVTLRARARVSSPIASVSQERGELAGSMEY
jgi:4-amino-4-deoxy-L-arabinose transferase-like glycosyltransferase